ncbi:hypothetical protein [Helicobacter canis]|uniref:16S ribosomal RNA methyltransferase RsmE n=1 Tax=Helicobacter canis TaxID=29419 RepID=A0A377JLY9_9HELI|nr:hypothetical protein [Helicobacter canis]STP06556.1 16S ribosomal RNA methyltransferase RsmE [Helicobacter canis]
MRDERLYTYKVDSISKRCARLSLDSSKHAPNAPRKHTHIIWAITQAKTIEKALPSFNELGLSKLSVFGRIFLKEGSILIWHGWSGYLFARVSSAGGVICVR